PRLIVCLCTVHCPCINKWDRYHRSYRLHFFFNDTAPTEIYTLPYTTLFRSPLRRISREMGAAQGRIRIWVQMHSPLSPAAASQSDRKSTRLNSSHVESSYAVFCLKKKSCNTRR